MNNINNIISNLFFGKNKKIYFYIDSTLPFSIFNKLKHRENFVFLARKNHLIAILNKFYFKKKKAINISSYSYLKLIYLLFKIKLVGNKIIFFHECCNPFLDTMLNFLKIDGFYFPIAKPLKMEKSRNYPAYKVKLLPFKKKIIYFFFHAIFKKFLFYIRISPDGLPVLYFVMKKYHKGIIKKKITNYNPNTINKIKFKNKLLIFLSKVPDCEKESFNLRMLDCFDKIIKYCNKKKISVYIKNHPNKSSRLTLKNKKLKYINPNKPAELIMYDDFDFYISLTSNSLCSFDKKAISVVNLLTKKPNVIKFYKQPFVNRNFKGIQYPKTYKDLFQRITKS